MRKSIAEAARANSYSCFSRLDWRWVLDTCALRISFHGRMQAQINLPPRRKVRIRLLRTLLRLRLPASLRKRSPRRTNLQQILLQQIRRRTRLIPIRRLQIRRLRISPLRIHRRQRLRSRLRVLQQPGTHRLKVKVRRQRNRRPRTTRVRIKPPHLTPLPTIRRTTKKRRRPGPARANRSRLRHPRFPSRRRRAGLSIQSPMHRNIFTGAALRRIATAVYAS